MTFAQLQTRVLSNSFGAGRYTSLAKDFLNEAVTEVCRALRFYQDAQVCAYASTGVVTQPSGPFFEVQGVWTALSGATGSGDNLIARYADRRLEPLDTTEAPDYLYVDRQPLFYTTRRDPSPTGTGPGAQLVIVPVSSTGNVIVRGLRRPTAMSADADTSGLGSDLDAALIAYAKARCFESEDDVQMAGYWDGRYATLVRSGGALVQTDGPIVTPGPWGE